MTDLLLTDRPFQPDVNNAAVSTARRSAALPVDAPSTYPFPRDTEESLHWEEVDAQLRENRIYWLATVRPDGRPHLAPIWGAWVEDAFYFQGAPTSLWARNLAETPLASIHLESAIDVVIVDGEIEFVQTEPELAEVLIDAWQTKYGNMIPAPETQGLYRLRAGTVVAWGATLQDAARWQFQVS